MPPPPGRIAMFERVLSDLLELVPFRRSIDLAAMNRPTGATCGSGRRALAPAPAAGSIIRPRRIPEGFPVHFMKKFAPHIVVGLMLVVAIGYSMGKTMAQRDNARADATSIRG